MAVETLQKGVANETQLLDSRHVDVGQVEVDIELEKMVQVFMVVQCYSCKTFQVHQVKKVNKWVCKMCNEKQLLLKTYGKGSARECGKHVKKLNMLRGERERGVSGGIRGSHPPDDYANTFTTGRKESLDKMEHPVVLADTKKSKWTSFLQPSKDEDEEESSEYTTEKDVFTEATKTRRKARRSLSERKPHPLVSHDQGEEVCPYSSVNQQMEPDLMAGSKSMHGHQDRYTKLDTPTEQQGHSHSMCDLSASPSSPDSHKEWMSQIKRDLEPFTSSISSGGQSAESRAQNMKGTQKVSKWSQFMCEVEGETVDTTPSLQDRAKRPAAQLQVNKATS